MKVQVKYDVVDLEEFLKMMDKSAETKALVWRENKVSDKLFRTNLITSHTSTWSNTQKRAHKYPETILHVLEEYALCDILKDLTSNKNFRDCLSFGLFFVVLVNMKPSTVKTTESGPASIGPWESHSVSCSSSRRHTVASPPAPRTRRSGAPRCRATTSGSSRRR